MITLEFWVLIDTAPERVYDYLSNLNHLPEWQKMVKKILPIAFPLQVGTTGMLTVEVGGRSLEGKITITRAEPSACLAYEMQSGPTRVQAEIMLSPAGGGTRLDLHGQAEPAGIFKLAEKALQGQVQAQMQQNLAALKSILEKPERSEA